MSTPLGWLAALLLPGCCSCCLRPGHHPACAGCLGELASLPVPSGAVFPDAWPAGRLVRAAKQGRARAAVPMLASMALARCPDTTWRGTETVTWVPPDPIRARRRGMHLPEMYGRELARRLGLDARPMLARSTGPPQRHRSRSERLHGMRESMRLARANLAPTKGGTGTILLVDDVRTTGATLAAGAAMLEHAGWRVRTHVIAAVPRREGVLDSQFALLAQGKNSAHEIPIAGRYP